jgi:hypothetical protein
MIEFKFPCPNCGQRIQVSDAYSRRQIDCPACQKPIMVPHLPGTLPAIPPIAVPPLPPAQLQPAVPLSDPTVTARKKSRTKWAVICGATGLVVVGAIAFVLFSGVLSRSDSDLTGALDKKAAARTGSKRSASTGSSSLSATEIVQKIAEQYESLSSYSASGTTVSVMDMSKTDPKNMPGMAQLPADAKDSKAFQQAVSKPIRAEIEFTAMLGRPDFYRVEWENKAGPVGMKGAVWSIGEGDYLSITAAKYMKMESREMALASATGVSGGVAGTLPGIFFKDSTSQLKLFKKAERGEDETVDGEDCYVLRGDAMGSQVNLWVTKDKFLIKQKQMVLGGKSTMPDMDDAAMEQGLEKMGKLTPEQKAQAKAAMKNMKPMLSQMKGSITETYRQLEINKPVKKEDFNYELPAGAVLSKSLF